ncbi:MAG: NAD-dependent epimerase/dehydratase [Bacteroidetes bacterium]|nr:MAG: NAD-dependent epimerase/dehydratase [Bacteroidota bacterium]
MKKALILGGTQFIGRQLIRTIENAGGYEITLFNRGKTAPGLFPHLEQISGDRYTDDIDRLNNRSWDIAVDFSCYFPKNFRALLKKLEGHAGKYIHISTISVYDLEKNNRALITEDSPLYSYGPGEEADPAKAHYGQNKRECERIVLEQTAFEKIILRPSLVYGEYDHTDRLYYWLYRLKNNLPVLIPGKGKDGMTFTYVKDLATILFTGMNKTVPGIVYNAVTNSPLALSGYISLMKKILGSKSESWSLPAEEVIAHGISPGNDLPLWYNTPVEISNQKLVHDFQPRLTSLEDSLRETIAYYDTLGWPEPKAGKVPGTVFSIPGIEKMM